MGRSSAANLSLRGRQRAAPSDEAVVRVEGLGTAVGETQWHEKSEGGSRAKIGRYPALHLDRRDLIPVEQGTSLIPYYLNPKSQG